MPRSGLIRGFNNEKARSFSDSPITGHYADKQSILQKTGGRDGEIGSRKLFHVQEYYQTFGVE
jgi:hypothetical protein